MTRQSRRNGILGVILLVALALRMWNIRQDLPYHYYHDESGVVYDALKMGTGDLNPHYFIYPTLWYYALLSLYGCYFLVGKMAGLFGSARDFALLYLKDPSSFFLLARTLAALMGTAAVWATYRLGKRLFGKSIGLIAAAFFAVLPLHVQNSHYAIVDTPMVTLFICSLFLIASVMRKGKSLQYALSGIVLGLAVATKYTAGVTALSLFYAHWVISRQRNYPFQRFAFSRDLWVSYLLACAAFIIACPFSVLDYRTFIGDLVNQWQCSQSGWYGWEKQPKTLAFFFFGVLKDGMSIPLWIVSLAGIAYAFIRHTKEDILLLTSLVFYLAVMAHSKLTYARYMLPVLPIAAVVSARLVSDLAGTLPLRTKKAAWSCRLILTAGLIFSPLSRSINIDRVFARPALLTQVTKWIEVHIPQGSRILVDEYSMPLVNTPENLRALQKAKLSSRKDFGYRKMTDMFFELQLEAARQAPISYRLTTLPHPVGYLADEKGYHQEWVTIDAVSQMTGYRGKYDYIVISEYRERYYSGARGENIPKRFNFMRDFYRSVQEHCRLVQEFSEGGSWQIRIYQVL